MLCLAIGLGVLGTLAFHRARRCHRGWHHGDWADRDVPPWHRHRRRHWMMHAALARIDATPAQERVIVGELGRLRERAHDARAAVLEARGDLAAALRGSTLDDAALDGVLGRVDAASAELRGAAIDAVRAVHGVLDDAQRAQLADLIDHRAGWWRAGPYR